jgi:hypothetical protein
MAHSFHDNGNNKNEPVKEFLIKWGKCLCQVKKKSGYKMHVYYQPYKMWVEIRKEKNKNMKKEVY